ncbi:hypothetical protein HanRHA438_Chr09g0417911 [Helianthus annuus]|uniref:Secreted protein n=1 Tax=Helianthus annuus TaxID=4232 RepID=A0A9K3I8V0_HELAN|nr:hypothetical protein HanXRQr2_Chr09g0405911 [Helianthus annuus]KAJ0889906.1 hypothetical protein HanRHA438_Chr09g0417911 [Helianthus annuus]KAJ0894688.1 hypothetical protein HanPSC8_Chr09g0391821 [Helianthus annuus]
MSFIILLLQLLLVDIERNNTHKHYTDFFLVFISLAYLSLNHTSTTTATTVTFAPPPSIPLLCATI